MQNDLIFLVIFRAKYSSFWPFIKNLRNNYQITEKKLINLYRTVNIELICYLIKINFFFILVVLR